MRTALILISAGVLIVVAFAINPGVGILVALLAYGAVEGLLSHRPKKRSAEEAASAHRKSMGYK